VIRKRKLYPPLGKLEIERCGFHAFRHGNETVMVQENVPMALRQDRLGHSDARTTMMYSHVVSEDGRILVAKLGDFTCAVEICYASRERVILVPNGANSVRKRAVTS
jgi:hypothetical protein